MLSILAPSNVLPRSLAALTYFVFPIILVLYFVPTAVARRRGIRNGAGVILLNLFFGWTLIGWLLALAWAAMGTPAPRKT